jgi:HlyD family secretion protein
MPPTEPSAAGPAGAGSDVAREIAQLRIERSPASSGRPRRRWTRRVRRAVLLAILLAGVAAVALYPRFSTVAVRTAVVERVDPVQSLQVLTAGGYVIARNTVDVSSQITGRIEALLVDEGERVERGAVIARLDATDLRAQLAQAQAAADAAAAHLAELTAGPRPQEVAAARAEVAQARATAENADRELRRLRDLFQEQVVARTRLEQAERDAEVAAARLRAAEERAARVELGARPEQVAAARAELASARANTAYIAALLEKTVIRAPIAGTIVEKLVERGETVTTGFIGDRGARSALVSMADLTDLQVEADVNEADIRRLRLGQPAAVTPDAYPDRVYRAELTEIAPRANRRKATITVKAKVLAPDTRLRPEMSAKITFLERPVPEGARAAVLAPRAALTERDGRAGVFIVRDGAKAAFVPVTLAPGALATTSAEPVAPAPGPALVEVSAGLGGGEQVILDPPARLEDGDRVEPGPAAGGKPTAAGPTAAG